MKRIKQRLIYVYNTFRYPIRIASPLKTINEIQKGKSISRFGDGEFYLIFGQKECYQPYSDALRKCLADVLSDSQHNEHCLICLPYSLNRLFGLTDRSKDFWTDYQISHRKRIFDITSRRLQYYDAQITRLYINKKDKRVPMRFFARWKQLWAGKNVLIAEGSKTRFGMKNDLLDGASSIRRIVCPAEGAFEKIDLIEAAIRAESGFDLCLLALGPTASILAYTLSQCGIQAIDIGNLDIEYEWSLAKATVMTAVEGKYTCEAIDGSDGKNVTEADDPVYLSQVIKIIQ